MSGQIKLKAASLGGDITLTPTDTASNFVVTIPAGTSTLVTNATLPTQLNASGSAPIYACRAWVNFNGTGTVAIRASGNVSSITDNGVGQYTVNFTTAMSDANYAAVPGAGEPSGDSNANAIISNMATTGTGISVKNGSFAYADYGLVTLSIFR
jgi:hypothetical protein